MSDQSLQQVNTVAGDVSSLNICVPLQEVAQLQRLPYFLRDFFQFLHVYRCSLV